MSTQANATDHELKVMIRAYEIWEHEGYPDSKHLDHWAQAEAELGAPEASPPKATKSKAAAAPE